MTTLYQVDAFTDRVFAGNPAAVCVLEEARPDAWMQNVAMEMNLSETAFLLPENGAYRLRWFTPAKEVDLCGHATLASAFTLWQTGCTQETLRFKTRSGELQARRAGDWIELDFPALPVEEVAPPAGLVESLGATPVRVGRLRFAYLAEFADEQAVRNLSPDFGRMKSLAAEGIVATAVADGNECDFVSRFFAPNVGIDEDPVTGSTHCALGPYWAVRLGKETVVGYQASRRGGIVRVRVSGDRVQLGGQAVQVAEIRLAE
ncbi:PhzF family phenazine biosynthesis protein [bacterium]|nr:PhzF family phenazine biosynthesis protein [bacterium]